MDNKKGVVHLIPILLAGLFIAGFVMYTTVNTVQLDQTSVLSSDDEKEDEEDEHKDEDDDHDENEQEFEFEAETEENGVKVKTKIKLHDGEAEFEYEEEVDDDATDSGTVRNKVSVRNRTNFPLTVDSETNELVITTQAGVKTVVLPSVAIQNMINNGLFDQVVSEVPDSTDSAEFEIKEDEDGELTFEVETVDNQRFFGLFNVAIHKNVKFSAENGEVLNTNTPFFERLLDLFSF